MPRQGIGKNALSNEKRPLGGGILRILPVSLSCPVPNVASLYLFSWNRLHQLPVINRRVVINPHLPIALVLVEKRPQRLDHFYIARLARVWNVR